MGVFDEAVGAVEYDADNFAPAYDDHGDMVYLRYIGSETDCAKIPWDGVPGIKSLYGMFENRSDMTNIEGFVPPDTVNRRVLAGKDKWRELTNDEILQMAGFEEPIVAKGMKPASEREIPSVSDNWDDAHDLHYHRELL